MYEDFKIVAGQGGALTTLRADGWLTMYPILQTDLKSTTDRCKILI